MISCTVDTNVPIVANGNETGGKNPTIDCRLAAVTFLKSLVESGRVFLDQAGEIQNEYRVYLNPKGQPGVGDRFYREVLNSRPGWVVRVELRKRDDGEFEDLP